MRHEISINVKSTEIHAPNDLKILFKTIPLETMSVLTSTMNTIQSVAYIIEIVVATS